jgi:hypothetical protein
MKVSYQRTVTAADGSPLHADDFQTAYARWYDYVLFGPGVVPPAGAIVR